jgi:uncharacterized protein YjbJ (UPF0337 family)
MNFNKENIEGKWKEIKGDLHKAWGKITDDEWEQTKGDVKAISGLIQQKYGDAKDEISKKVGGVFDKYFASPGREALQDSKKEIPEQPLQ